MDWTIAESLGGTGSVSSRVLAAIRRLIEVRTSLTCLHASVGTECQVTSNPAVLVFRRRHAAGNIVQVYNLSESAQEFEADALWPLTGELDHEHLSDTEIRIVQRMTIPPYGAWWLTST